MIDTFPKFTPLSISLRQDVAQVCSAFEPYSDFNFTSLYCWNTDGTTAVSLLNGNLIINLPDYVSGKPIYALIGNNDLDQSIMTILKKTESLELVPESTINEIKDRKPYSITEDPDQFDYIYSLPDHATLAGGRFKAKRKLLARYLKTYGAEMRIEPAQLSDPKIRQNIETVFELWAQQKGHNDDTRQEQKALQRLLESHDSINTKGFVVMIGEEVAGFSITEVLDTNFAIYHFQKALHKYSHLDIYLTKISSEQLLSLGCKYINWEQDLGIKGLRDSKRAYQPIYMLKKYSVELVK